jgi:catechol 2,3-dioxygenase-like lactoylglutathione lyase family enzyme
MKFRVARHTDSLEQIIKFYTDILGLEIIGEFKNHNNYDGVFMSKEGLDWHLEFTTSNAVANHKADKDDLLVFYVESEKEYSELNKKI